MSVFEEMGKYWTEIADKDQTERQVDFVEEILKPHGYILDLACGSGRHMIPLSADGYNTVGLDISPKLLKIAKQRYRDIAVILADMRFLPFKDSAFGAVVSLDTSFGYLPSEADDRVSLAEVRRVLSIGHIVVVDVFNREYLMNRYKEGHVSKWMEYPSFYLQQTRTIAADGKRLCDLWVIRDKANGQLAQFQHSVRLYSQTELKNLLQNAHLIVNQVFGDYEKHGYNTASLRLIMVAQVQ